MKMLTQSLQALQLQKWLHTHVYPVFIVWDEELKSQMRGSRVLFLMEYEIFFFLLSRVSVIQHSLQGDDFKDRGQGENWHQLMLPRSLI